MSKRLSDKRETRHVLEAYLRFMPCEMPLVERRRVRDQSLATKMTSKALRRQSSFSFRDGQAVKAS